MEFVHFEIFNFHIENTASRRQFPAKFPVKLLLLRSDELSSDEPNALGPMN